MSTVKILNIFNHSPEWAFKKQQASIPYASHHETDICKFIIVVVIVTPAVCLIRTHMAMQGSV